MMRLSLSPRGVGLVGPRARRRISLFVAVRKGDRDRATLSTVQGNQLRARQRRGKFRLRLRLRLRLTLKALRVGIAGLLNRQINPYIGAKLLARAAVSDTQVTHSEARPLTGALSSGGDGTLLATVDLWFCRIIPLSFLLTSLPRLGVRLQYSNTKDRGKHMYVWKMRG